MNLRISIKNSKNFRTKQFKNNLWENTNIQKNIQKQTLLHAMAMASKGLLTEINEDDTIRIVFLVNFETPSYIKGYHEYQKIYQRIIYQRISWVSWILRNFKNAYFEKHLRTTAFVLCFLLWEKWRKQAHLCIYT